MKLQKIYTALRTANLEAAEAWYTKLLGRGPDYRPMDTLVQWELSDRGGVMVSTDEEIAAAGMMFIVVDDLAAERRRLEGLGIVLGDDNEGDYSKLARVRDPDGNVITGVAALTPLSASANFWVNAVAKPKPATCQNHTLVTKNPTPSPSNPTNEHANADSAIAHACQ